MEQAISLGTAAVITGCALLLAATVPTLSQVLNSKASAMRHHLRERRFLQGT